MVNIREARVSDCPQILDLIRALALYEKAPGEVSISLRDLEEGGFGAKPVWKAFVAEHHTGLVGFALYYVRFSTWKGQRLYLEDIFVKEEFRGEGIGKQLFEMIIAEAREKEFKGIVWQVLQWNEPAIAFYKKYNARFDGEWINVSMEPEDMAIAANK